MIQTTMIELVGMLLWSISDVLLGAAIALLGSWLFYRLRASYQL